MEKKNKLSRKRTLNKLNKIKSKPYKSRKHFEYWALYFISNTDFPIKILTDNETGSTEHSN